MPEKWYKISIESTPTIPDKNPMSLNDTINGLIVSANQLIQSLTSIHPLLFNPPNPFITSTMANTPSTTGLATSAATFSGTPALQALSIAGEIQDAYMAIGRATERTMMIRMGSVLDTQMASLATEADWNTLATSGTAMVLSDMRRLMVLKNAIKHLLQLNEEVIRSWDPNTARTLDDSPDDTTARLVGWTDPAPNRTTRSSSTW